MRLACAHCGNPLELAELGGRCPKCGSVFEVYYDQAEAEDVAATYNKNGAPATLPAAVQKFEDSNGWVVFFRDEGRLSEIASEILRGKDK